MERGNKQRNLDSHHLAGREGERLCMQTLKFLKAVRELLALSNTTLPELQNSSRNTAKSGQKSS